MALLDVGVDLEHVQAIRSKIGPELVEKCRMFKMSQFEPISGKKLRVFPSARLFKHRYIFLRLKAAFTRHFINSVNSIY
jgi:hypothetical protein